MASCPRSVARAGWARSRAGGEGRGARVVSDYLAGVLAGPGRLPAARGCGTRDPNVPSWVNGTAFVLRTERPRFPFVRCIRAFSSRFHRGAIIVACAFSGASIPHAGPILLSLVVALVLVPNATAYEVPSKLNEVTHVYSLGVGEVRCPSREEWADDWASSFGWAYTNIREDYTVLGPSGMHGRTRCGKCRRSSVATSSRRLGSHARGVPRSPLAVPEARGKAECQALANFRDATRRLGATAAQVEHVPLRAGAARLQGQALPPVQRSEVRNSALGSTDNNWMTSRHDEGHAESPTPWAAYGPTQAQTSTRPCLAASELGEANATSPTRPDRLGWLRPGVQRDWVKASGAVYAEAHGQGAERTKAQPARRTSRRAGFVTWRPEVLR